MGYGGFELPKHPPEHDHGHFICEIKKKIQTVLSHATSLFCFAEGCINCIKPLLRVRFEFVHYLIGGSS